MTEDYRLLITGTRQLDQAGRKLVIERLVEHLEVARSTGRRLVVVQGCCPSGADKEAREWGWMMQRAGEPVAVEGHHPTKHPTEDFGWWPECGPRRNRYMVGLGADACEAFIDTCKTINCRRPGIHASHGASGCADLAEAAKIPTVRWDLWKT